MTAAVRARGPGRRAAQAERGVVVVVPVHDEEDRLGACLSSIQKALAHPTVQPLRTTVVVVLDACRDRSAAVAAAWRRPTDVVVATEARNVGAARALGVRTGLDALGLEAEHVWLAHTDADSTVPRSWLARQLGLAPKADAVAGIVRVGDWEDHHRLSTRLRFERSYRALGVRPHPHVHGANLGVRASSYLAAGGFPALRCSEDHALWNALRSGGHRVVASRRLWVTTSGRRVVRAPGGFGDTLRAIEAASEPG